MADTIKIKRSSSSATPAALSQGELAYSEVSDTLFIGISGPAVKAIAGGGVFVKSASPSFTGSPTAPTAANGTNTNQIATTAFVTTALSGYLTNNAASEYSKLNSPEFTGTPTVPTASGGTNSTQAASTAFVQNTLSAYLTNSNAASTYAVLVSPSFTGVPVVPTAAQGTNTNQIASTAFVHEAISGLADSSYIDNKISVLIGAAPSTLDTIVEIDNAIGNDPNFATTMSTALATKLVKSSNLSDLSNFGEARTNLGLGDLSTQSSGNVSITGGLISGVSFTDVVLDGGIF